MPISRLSFASVYSSICTKSVVIAYINSYKQPLYFEIPGVAVFSDSSPSLGHDRSLSPVHHYRSLISISLRLIHNPGIAGPHLIVVPKSTLQNWACEWTPQVNIVVLAGTKEEPTQIIANRLKISKFVSRVTKFASSRKSPSKYSASNLLSSMKHIQSQM